MTWPNCDNGFQKTDVLYAFFLFLPFIIICSFFFSWWGERGSKCHKKQAIIGPPVKRHWNGISLAGRWWANIKCWLGSFAIFQGASGPLSPQPPLVPCMLKNSVWNICFACFLIGLCMSLTNFKSQTRGWKKQDSHKQMNSLYEKYTPKP